MNYFKRIPPFVSLFTNFKKLTKTSDAIAHIHTFGTRNICFKMSLSFSFISFIYFHSFNPVIRCCEDREGFYFFGINWFVIP